MENETKQDGLVSVDKVPDERKVKDKYSIYMYLKEHPAVFIACISAAVAVVSFCLNAIEYIRVYRQLQYWDMLMFNIKIVNENRVYIIFSSLLFSVFCYFAQQFLFASCEVYMRRRRGMICLEYQSRIYKRQSKSNQKSIKELEYIIKHETPKDQDALNELDKIKNDACQNDEKAKKTHASIRKLLLAQSKEILPSSLTFIVIILLFLILNTYISGSMTLPLSQNILSIVLTAAFITVISYGFSFLTISSVYNQDMRKYANDAGKLDALFKEYEKECNAEYPIAKLFGLNLRSWLTNSNIMRSIRQCAIAFLIFIVTMFICNDLTIRSQSEFNICNIDDTDYAVMYQIDGDYYLEEVTVAGDKITVDTTHKKIVCAENITVRTKKFKTVARITSRDDPKETGNTPATAATYTEK